MRVLVYCRVSTREQGDSGLGLEAQEARCRQETTQRGWSPLYVKQEIQSAGRQRPILEECLRMMDVGTADVLMVSRIDRLARSVGQLARIMDRAQTRGWQLVVLSPAVDMTDPYGRMMAQVAMSFAELERSLGSIRTKEGLERARARGTFKPLPRYADRSTIRRIVRKRLEGNSRNAIAKWLTEAGVPSPNNVGRWNHKMVGAILKREGVE